MRKRALLGLVAVLALSMYPCTTSLAKPAVADAFLVDYAETIQQLVGQVEDSRLIALRYAKHFRSDPSSVLRFFRNDLSVTKLDEPMVLTVYFLDASRNIVSEQRNFKAGTTVFANKAGVPILQFGTGNPLAATLLPGARPLAEETLTQKPGAPAPNDKVAVQVLEQPPTEIGPTATGTPPTTATTTAPTTATTATTGPVVASASGLPPVASGGGPSIGGSSNWLVPLGLAGAAFAVAGGGGGGSSSIPTNGDEPTPVPEPSSIMALAAGMAALGGMRWRRGTRR